MRANHNQTDGQLDLAKVKAGDFVIRPLSLNDFLVGDNSSLGRRIPDVALD